MKHLFRTLSALTLSFLFTSIVSSQPAPYVLKTFHLTQLDARPGKVIVSPDVLTLIEFNDQVEDVSTARPDAMTIEVTGNIIRLRANWRAGSTDLVVTIGNRTAMFTVEIDPEGENTRRYVVQKPEPPRAVASRTERTSGSRTPDLLDKLSSNGAIFPDWARGQS